MLYKPQCTNMPNFASLNQSARFEAVGVWPIPGAASATSTTAVIAIPFVLINFICIPSFLDRSAWFSKSLTKTSFIVSGERLLPCYSRSVFYWPHQVMEFAWGLSPATIAVLQYLLPFSSYPHQSRYPYIQNS